MLVVVYNTGSSLALLSDARLIAPYKVAFLLVLSPVSGAPCMKGTCLVLYVSGWDWDQHLDRLTNLLYTLDFYGGIKKET